MPSPRALLDRAVDRTPPRVRAVGSLLVATARDAGRDRVTGLAAEIAFWVILSLPPLLLTTAAGAGLIGRSVGTDVRARLVERLREIAGQVFSDATVDETLGPVLEGLLEEGSPSLLSISFAATLYAASRAFWVVVHAIAIAYDLEEARPSWISRLLGLGLTLTAMVLGLVLIPVVVAGPRLGAILERRLGLDVWLAEAWRVLYWPVSLVVVTLLIASLYHVAMPWSTPFRRDLPGAALATVLGLASAFGLRLYTANAFEGDALYAPIAAPLAVLVFLYLQGLALLVGAELNAEIEKADPVGTAAPETPRLIALGRRAVSGARDLTGDRPG